MKTKMRPKEGKKIPCRRGADLVVLPDEIINNILLRLPVKSLLRFKCVCTSWLSLISDPLFTKSHLEKGSPTMKILMAPPFQLMDCQFLDETYTKDSVVDLSLLAMMPKMRPRILGSCDGLVAFRNDGHMILWNPSTRMFRKLPSLKIPVREYMRLYGIGYDLKSDDYKVIVGFLPMGFDWTCQLTVKVLCLRTNTWRERGYRVSFTVRDTHERGVFLGDAVHWMVKQFSDRHCVPSIVSMNLADESIGEVIPLPDLDWEYSWSDLGLAVLQSRMALHVNDTHTRQFMVWIMNEYAVKSSWTKLFVIPLDVLGWRIFEIDLLAITRTGKIIIGLYKARLVLLEPQRLTVERLPVGIAAGSWFSAVAYTETLVSPPGFQHIREI